MKITLLLCASLLLSLNFAGAQTTASTNSSSSPKLPPPILDNDEMMKLKTVRDQVLAAHPELKVEEEKLKTLHDSSQSQNPPPTADQRNAMFAEWKSYQKTMRGEMLKIDPTLKPIFAKLDSARKNGAASPFQPATK